MSCPRAFLALLAVLLLPILPAAASATVYTVNTKADEADKTPGAPCETNAGPGVCSLWAAIEVANSTAAEADTILFSSFNGQLSSTISIATPFETISSPLEINGGTCLTAAGESGPCVGVSGPAGSTAFTVTAENSSIYDLAIANASTGVRDEADKFIARGNWFGVKLDGSLGTSGAFGIAVGPGADQATIGGTQEVQRNVFADSTTGLQLRGASNAVVQGNFFGVLPDGETAAPNTRNLVVADSLGPLPDGTPATNNLIGADVETGAGTAACDLGCNVFAGTSLGAPAVDLQGSGAFEEKAATGPTTIRGNFVGLDATGTGVLANAGIDIWTAGADQVTVGGTEAGDANYLAGGSEGIVSESGGDGFEALGNRIGFKADGSAATAPGKGIFALALGVSEEPKIESNEIRVAGGNGIEVKFAIGRITGNFVEGAATGILIGVGGGGGLIASNTVEAPSAAGILLEESNDNEVRDNTVVGAGGAGIAVEPPPGGVATTGNLIGGNKKDHENTIEGSAGPAIEIVETAGEPGSWTEIARNHGAGNGGLFIDLVNGANEGILPPTVTGAQQTAATGTAEAEATVRVYRKASGEPGELAGFLGEAVADGSGNWKVTFGSIPGGTRVTATQTNANGATSELAQPVAVVAESGGAGGNSSPPPPPPPADVKPPLVKITKGPAKKSAKTTAKFTFSANEPSSFQCKLDKGKFKKCRSPKTYKKLKPGKHVFQVKAADAAGNVSKPVKRKFTVLPAT